MTQPPPHQPPPPPPSEPPPTAACTMCGGQLVPGYLGSLANKMAYTDVQWFEGRTSRDWAMGLKSTGGRQSDIAAFCCVRCGHLELYTAPGWLAN